MGGGKTKEEVEQHYQRVYLNNADFMPVKLSSSSKTKSWQRKDRKVSWFITNLVKKWRIWLSKMQDHMYYLHLAIVFFFWLSAEHKSFSSSEKTEYNTGWSCWFHAPSWRFLGIIWQWCWTLTRINVVQWWRFGAIKRDEIQIDRYLQSQVEWEDKKEAICDREKITWY